MSVTQDTFERALRVIETGDEQQLKRLIRKPVSTQRTQLDRLMQLVQSAAAHGLIEAVDHLLALAPTLEQRGVVPTSNIPTLTDAWVAAHEAQQNPLAQALLARLPTGEGYVWDEILADRFLRARKARAWSAAEAVLDLGYRPDIEPIWQAAIALNQERGDRQSLARHMLRRLMDVTPATALAWVAETAIILGDDEALASCLALAGQDKVKTQLNSLLHTTVRADRPDLAHRLMHQYNPHCSPQTWLDEVIMRAITRSRIAFVHAILDHRPAILEHIHADSMSAGHLGWLVVHTCHDNRLIDRAMDEGLWQRLVARMCPGELALDVRYALEQNLQEPEQAESRRGHLNLLALWTDSPIREMWFEREPVTFSEAIAAERSQGAAEALPEKKPETPKRSRRRT